MKTIRVIPRLDIKGPSLVKGIHLEGLRVLGKPEDFARHYYESGADELFYVDVVASLFERNSLEEIVSRTAKEIFIPLTVGGGLRSMEDITRVLRAGADKVSLNTAALKRPDIIKEAAERFGSSTIVITIETIKEANGTYLCYTDNGREYTGMDAFEWAGRACDLGAGEIVVTSVDREGTGLGFDIELTRKISEIVSVPVIAHGGAGSVQDILEVLRDGKADAVSIGSILHYGYIATNTATKGSPKEGNVEFLRSGRSFEKIKPCTISDIKNYISQNSIECRI